MKYYQYAGNKIHHDGGNKKKKTNLPIPTKVSL